MTTFLLEIVNYLRDLGIVEGDGVDTYRDFMPDKPDKVVVLYEYAGFGSIRGAAGVGRSVQISVRTLRTDVSWGREKIWEIFNVLDTPDMIIDGREDMPPSELWGVFRAIQTPFRMQIDDANRWVYTFNLAVITSRELV